MSNQQKIQDIIKMIKELSFGEIIELNSSLMEALGIDAEEHDQQTAGEHRQAEPECLLVLPFDRRLGYVPDGPDDVQVGYPAGHEVHGHDGDHETGREGDRQGKEREREVVAQVDVTEHRHPGDAEDDEVRHQHTYHHAYPGGHACVYQPFIDE